MRSATFEHGSDELPTSGVYHKVTIVMLGEAEWPEMIEWLTARADTITHIDLQDTEEDYENAKLGKDFLSKVVAAVPNLKSFTLGADIDDSDISPSLTDGNLRAFTEVTGGLLEELDLQCCFPDEKLLTTLINKNPNLNYIHTSNQMNSTHTSLNCSDSSASLVPLFEAVSALKNIETFEYVWAVDNSLIGHLRSDTLVNIRVGWDEDDEFLATNDALVKLASRCSSLESLVTIGEADVDFEAGAGADAAEPSKKKRNTNFLEGCHIAITGTLSQPRKAIVSVIESHGGVFSKSITKKTTHLISARNDTVKAKKAIEKGIKIVTEAFVETGEE